MKFSYLLIVFIISINHLFHPELKFCDLEIFVFLFAVWRGAS